jgi:hypothetical protein
MVPGANGYMMVAEDGGIFSFGDVSFLGSLGATPPSSPIKAVSLWTESSFIKAGDPPPPHAPAHTYDWVTVDLDPADPQYNVVVGSGEGETASFTVSGDQQSAVYTCSDHGTYSYGCSFRVLRYSDGQYQDSWMPDAFTGDAKSHTLHLAPGTYYIEANEYGDNTIWGVGILDHACTANCG